MGGDGGGSSGVRAETCEEGCFSSTTQPSCPTSPSPTENHAGVKTLSHGVQSRMHSKSGRKKMVKKKLHNPTPSFYQRGQQILKGFF